MIEVTIYNYLNNALSVPVYTELPKEKPKRYVVLDKIGSSKENHLLSSTIAFQSYAESKYEAALLNEQVKEAVENMIELDEIAGVSLNNDYNFTDTTTKEYRYQAVFDINHY
jgi:hypothetical protein